MTSPWPVRTGSLVMREATADDVEQLLAFRNLPEVNEFMLRTSVEPDVFRAEWAQVPASDTDFSCVVERDGDIVAMAWLEFNDADVHPDTPPRAAATIGYLVRPQNWRQGIASAVVPELLRAAFGLGAHRVDATCHADNVGSARVLAKNLRLCGHARRRSWHHRLGWVDGLTFSLNEDEWRTGVRAPTPPPLEKETVTFDVVDGVDWPRRTARLKLRTPTPDDIDQMFTYVNDPQVTRWLLHRELSYEEHVSRWERHAHDPAKNRFVAVVDGHVVGAAKVDLMPAEEQPGGPGAHEAEIGYVMNPAFAGRGYATELASACVDIALRDRGARAVIADLYADNVASAAVLAKLGMRREGYGVRNSWHPRVGWTDDAHFAIRVDEWRGGRWEL